MTISKRIRSLDRILLKRRAENGTESVFEEGLGRFYYITFFSIKVKIGLREIRVVYIKDLVYLAFPTTY